MPPEEPPPSTESATEPATILVLWGVALATIAVIAIVEVQP